MHFSVDDGSSSGMIYTSATIGDYPRYLDCKNASGRLERATPIRQPDGGFVKRHAYPASYMAGMNSTLTAKTHSRLENHPPP